jgi:hypothetical protein
VNEARTAGNRGEQPRVSVRRATRAAALALCLSSASAAHAQALDNVSREAATSLAMAGIEAYEAGSYLDALDKLEKSYTIAQVPTLALWSARALQKLGRWLEAEERYNEGLRLPIPEGDTATQQQALVEMRAELATLSPAVPRVLLQVEGARLEELELRIDGRLAPSTSRQRLNPGSHHIEGTRGNDRAGVDVDVSANDKKTVLLRFALAPQPSSAPSAEPASGSDWLAVSGWTAVTAGAIGVTLGTVGLVLAIQKKDEIDHNSRCRENACAPSERDLVDSYDARRNLSTIGFIAGGALAALGVGALVLSGGESDDPRAEAVFSPAFTGIRGSF